VNPLRPLAAALLAFPLAACGGAFASGDGASATGVPAGGSGHGGATTTSLSGGGHGGGTSPTGAGGHGGAATSAGGHGGATSTGAGGVGGSGGAPLPCHPGVGQGVVVVQRKVLLGDTDWNGNPSTDAWKHIGLDLDGKNSTAKSKDLCKPYGGALPKDVYPDGDDGIDNAWGRSILPIALGLAADVPAKAQDRLDQGIGNFMLQLVGVTPADDTCDIPIRFDVLLPLKNPPQFSSLDVWPLDPTWLADPGDAASTKLTMSGDLHANVITTSVPGHVVLTGATGFLDHQPLVLSAARVRLELDATHTSVVRGVLGGVLSVSDLVEAYQASLGGFDQGLCSGPTLDAILEQVRRSADILADGSQDPAKTCDGISIGLGFTALPANLGPVGQPPPPPPKPCAQH
jgi:hypothetical protein